MINKLSILRRLFAFLLGIFAVTQACARPIPRYGIFEATFTQAGIYENPYRHLDDATATFIGPNGTPRRIPLFWDGGKIWKLRFSPPRTGKWRWSIHSGDPELNGKSGTFRVVASDRHGGIQTMPLFPHHFRRQDGIPFWWMGDTNWALFSSNPGEHYSRAAAEHYIDVRARQGFNVVHTMLISEAGWGNRGGKPFDDLASQHINPKYWQEVDRRLVYLNRKGITAGLVLAWGDKGHNPANWHDFPSQEARERYARYVVARYSAYNVYFIVAGEWNSRGSDSKIRKIFNDIGRTIANADPHDRMIAIHPYGNASVMSFASKPWMSFSDYQQIYHHLHKHILDAYKHKPDKPVVNAEYAYFLRDRNGDGDVDKPNSASLREIRHSTWDIVMAGGYFITGFGTTYFGGNRDPGPFDVDVAKNNPWEQDLRHIKELFTDLQWWKLKPADHLVDGNNRQERGTQWVLAETGRQYLLYTRGTIRPLTLSLGDAPSGEYVLHQFNPRTGKLNWLKSYKGDGPITCTPPDKHDWVFIINSSSAHKND